MDAFGEEKIVFAAVAFEGVRDRLIAQNLYPFQPFAQDALKCVIH